MRKAMMATAALAVVLWGCGRNETEDQARTEKPAPAASALDAAGAVAAPKAATLAALLREPKAYAGKDVSVKGTFSGICCESDWFLKDGMDTIEVYSTKMCPMPSKSKIQSKVTVVGTVMLRNDHPAITAKELRFE